MNIVLVSVKVKAGARKETIEKVSDTKFKISVREKPEGNQANHRVIELLARHFQVTQKSIRIVKGHHSPSKIFTIKI
ncbi:MAG TPA: DUF167 domain-containing protein [Candidatus Paceibacterota bacterium]